LQETLLTEIVRIPVPIPLAVGWVNAYFVSDSIPTLIDTGVNTTEGWDAIVSAIRAHGATLCDLKRIIVTHGHGDHMGLAGKIAQAGDAEVFAHPWDLPEGCCNPGDPWPVSRDPFYAFLMESGVPEEVAGEVSEALFIRLRSVFGPMPAVSALKRGETFAFDDFRMDVFHTPGHSPGSVCLFAKDAGTLFSGDCLLEEVTSNPADRRFRIGGEASYRALDAYSASLDLIEGLPVKQVFPGHGDPYGDPQPRIAGLRAHHDARRTNILKILNGMTDGRHVRRATPFTIASILFPSVEGLELFYRVCATRVHLEVLEHEGIAACRTESGTLRYFLSEGSPGAANAPARDGRCHPRTGNEEV
jgi:glyoxylase-like metal-dependent hydrolase (beta-lactamase superfamily II)